MSVFKSKGRYYELPIGGSSIRQLIYSGVLRLGFGDFEEDYLNLLGAFELKRHGQATLLLPKSPEALLLFYDLLNAGTTVQEAKADKEGRLFLTFEDHTEIAVQGPAEYWDFTRRSKRNPATNGSVSGGLGYLDF